MLFFKKDENLQKRIDKSTIKENNEEEDSDDEDDDDEEEDEDDSDEEKMEESGKIIAHSTNENKEYVISELKANNHQYNLHYSEFDYYSRLINIFPSSKNGHYMLGMLTIKDLP
jgi:hypothetical protein